MKYLKKTLLVILGITVLLGISILPIFSENYRILEIWIFFSVLVIIFPSLGIFFYIPVSLFLSGSYIFALPIRYLLLFNITLSLAINILLNRKRLRFQKSSGRMIIIMIVYIIWVFIREIQYNSPISTALTFILGYIASGFLIAIFITIVYDTPSKISKIIYMLIFWITLSAFTGIMQFLKVDLFLQLQNYMSTFITSEESRNEILLSRGIGSVGLSGLSTLFAYTTSFICTLAIGFSISKKGILRIFLLIAVGIILFGILTSFMMASIIGVLVGVNIFIFILGNKKLSFLFISLLVSLILLNVIQFITPNIFFRVFDQDGIARLPLSIVGYHVGIDNPFGVSRSQYFYEVTKYVKFVQDLPGYEYIYTASPHNNFINVFTIYGFPGLILYLMFYVLLWIDLIRVYVNCVKIITLKAITLGLIASFIVAGFNLFTHNAGLFYGETIAWYGVGMLWSISNFMNGKEINRIDSPSKIEMKNPNYFPKVIRNASSFRH